MGLVQLHRLFPPSDHIVGRHRLAVTNLVQRRRAEEEPTVFLEQNAGVPAVRQMRRRDEAEAVPTGVDYLVPRKAAGRAGGEVLEIDENADLAAGRLSPRRNREPVVEGATFIDLKIAHSYPAAGL